MFTKSAHFYDALYHFMDYGKAATEIHRLVLDRSPSATTLLDVGCGTGKHLEYLRSWFAAEGLDLNDDLLTVAQQRCPDLTFHQANMVDFDLGKTFDVVTCLFSSLGYVTDLADMRRAVARFAAHVRPGGAVIVEPWFSPETYWVDHLVANFVDQPDLKISWMYVSKLQDQVSVLDIHYLVGTPEGVDYFTERHEFGLYTCQEYMSAFCDAGLDVEFYRSGLFGRGVYVGMKPMAE